uniref:Uncharacterized protein MANES_01G007100 n=1 Tax=Rhizophora mucronata TaxID=61149 RepID=A0A2P2IPC1_RHIMU
MWAFSVVFDGDEKVSQTGQTWEAIVSEAVVQYEAMSSVEARSQLPPNFTISLHFLPDGRELLSVLQVTGGPPASAFNKFSVSKGEIDCLLSVSRTDSISDCETVVTVDGKSFSSADLQEVESMQGSANFWFK